MEPGAGRKWDQLIINAQLATMTDTGTPYGAISSAALAIDDQTIAWIGPLADLPAAPDDCAREVVSAGGHWITPGLIDCHTHLLFAGSRANEFEQRMEGVSYAEIAAAGGGINSTVQATRSASEKDLATVAASRLRHWLAEGVTTVEIKSGYGLDTEAELRMLRVARRVGERQPIEILTTFLGAHAVPPEADGDSDRYLTQVIEEMLPAVHEQGLADAVDAYCEHLAFSPEQIRRLFTRARELDLPVKLHADQLSNSHGAALAAEFGALSADHLEYTDSDGVAAMARSGTVAVMLPGAYYSLREQQRPPMAALRDQGVPMAVATDCNPGTSPLSSITVAMNLACVQFGMTPEEVLRGVTINAARALGLQDRVGSLEVGKRADLAIWRIDRPAHLAYWMGGRRCEHLYQAGQRVF